MPVYERSGKYVVAIRPNGQQHRKEAQQQKAAGEEEGMKEGRKEGRKEGEEKEEETIYLRRILQTVI